MKRAMILVLFTLSFAFINLQEEEEEPDLTVRITNIINTDAYIDGYLFLETDGILITPMSFNQENIFTLKIQNDENNKVSSIMCFFHQFDRFYAGAAKIACELSPRSVTPGKHHLVPLEKEMSFFFDEMYILSILPYNFEETINIIDDNLLYFYSLKKNQIPFFNETDTKNLKFDLYDAVTKETTIYLDDIPIKCQASGHRLTCPVTSKDFPQDDRLLTLNVYLKDSKGNKVINHMVYPIDFIFHYIKKQNLKIKVTKALTNCLTPFGHIVLETSDNQLGNVIYSKEGFYLNIKRTETDNYQLFCNFHKHPGENTKIFCEPYDDLEDDVYVYDEYLSEGPLEDERDRISPNYNIIVPTFKLNSKLMYISDDEEAERIYDAQLREKIYLNYKDKSEVEYFYLNHEYYKGNKDYYLGNNKVECSKINKDIIMCEVSADNFDESGIYYFEKINLLEERERLYMIPPFKVTLSWD